jgi:hypothetical protein
MLCTSGPVLTWNSTVLLLPEVSCSCPSEGFCCWRESSMTLICTLFGCVPSGGLCVVLSNIHSGLLLQLKVHVVSQMAESVATESTESRRLLASMDCCECAATTARVAWTDVKCKASSRHPRKSCEYDEVRFKGRFGGWTTADIFSFLDSTLS